MRVHRPTVVALLAVAGFLAACRKKPENVATPAANAAADSVRMAQQARADSVARASQAAAAASEAARRDAAAAAERERAAAEASRVAAVRETLTAIVYFDYDSADLTTQGQQTLEAKVPVMTVNAAVRIRVVGHTDNRGSDEYNLALGLRRAEAVRRFLTGRGVGESRIETGSLGEEVPADQGEDEGAFGRNRRAEFEIIAGGDLLGATQP